MPINIAVLRSLHEGPMSLMDLRRAAGSPPATTMRSHLRSLGRTGIVAQQRRNDFPGTLDFELAQPGRDLLGVAQTLEAWLALSPVEPLQLGSAPAKSAIKALVEGWTTSMVRALCAKRLSLTELSGLISSVSYPSLERRVTAMRLAGLIEACSGGGRSTPYIVSDWLRRAVAPIAAAIRWERRHVGERTAPLRRRDVEAIFLLNAPLLCLPAGAEGSCRLAVEIGRGDNQALSGVTLELREGRLASCVSRLEREAKTWAVGPSFAWLDAILDCQWDRIEFGGDVRLARDLVEAMHRALRLESMGSTPLSGEPDEGLLPLLSSNGLS